MSGDANNAIFSTMETDTIGEIMNISMGSAATAASTLMDKKVTITTPAVDVLSLEEFNIDPLEPAIAVEIKYVEGILGNNILILRHKDVGTILSQMMGTELEDNFEIDEMAESAMCEFFNQMMGSSATVLSCFLGRTINISTPTMVPISDWENFKKEHFPQPVLRTKFTLTIDNLMESEFISAMDLGLAREIIDVSLNFDAESTGEAAPAPAANSTPAQTAPPTAPEPPPQPQVQATPIPTAPPPAPAPFPTAAPTPAPAPEYGGGGVAAPPQAPPQAYAQPYPAYAVPPQGYMPPVQATENPIVIKDFEYGDFGGGATVQEAPTNMDLVMNVPVVVTVELGRTKRKIKDILEFGQGTIVELDKQAGSQVDVIVNGQLIAHGDVVVVGDNFSIRITEILKSRDSLTML